MLKTYVAIRIIEINELTGTYIWRHIRSEDNPADAISRGQLPRVFLKNKTWRAGPSWLVSSENDWSCERAQVIEILELRKNVCLATRFNDLHIFEKYSSYSKLCRIIAYCLRVRPTNKYHGPFCAKEIDKAERRVIKILQSARFSSEIKDLENKQSP